ncbi:hypothetical protein PsAD46_02111 [Pseudovibrio sp. Ad46]|nr:hypothetical protein PsAD46_02111 [Pseudovibrio sp. Ad46]KZK92788.1 hypothetical protein PsAD5_03509 [Pseudovibrio sp. Ad5]
MRLRDLIPKDEARCFVREMIRGRAVFAGLLGCYLPLPCKAAARVSPRNRRELGTPIVARPGKEVVCWMNLAIKLKFKLRMTRARNRLTIFFRALIKVI